MDKRTERQKEKRTDGRADKRTDDMGKWTR